ncbi:uncharacterized protein LOC144142847 isoform X1 [Haemaphysalis longicornis]
MTQEPERDQDHAFQTLPLNDGGDDGDRKTAPLPAVASAAGGVGVRESWWERRKCCYAQQWKKKDRVWGTRPAMLGLPATTAALMAHLVGFGMVSMPLAFSGIGWTAIILVPLFGALSAYNAALLNSCCEILEKRHEQYRTFYWYTHYSDIATKALGPFAGGVVVALRLLCAIGVQAVATLLAAGAFTDLILALTPPLLRHGLVFCICVVTFGVMAAAFQGPLSTDVRYWCNIIVLPLSTILFVLLLTGAATDIGKIEDHHDRIGGLLGLPLSRLVMCSEQSAASFFVSLGIISFNFASIAGFTHVRGDMGVPTDFDRAAGWSVTGGIVAFSVVGGVGYGAYDLCLNGNLALSMRDANIRLATEFFVFICCFATSSLVGLALDAHDTAENYGKRCVWGRAKLSSPLMLAACLLALCVPFEGPLMALVGSVVVCPMVYLLPPIFYASLCRGSSQRRRTPLSRETKGIIAVVLFVGVLVFLGGTVAAIVEIVRMSKDTPYSCITAFCYDDHFQLAKLPSIYHALEGATDLNFQFSKRCYSNSSITEPTYPL